MSQCLDDSQCLDESPPDHLVASTSTPPTARRALRAQRSDELDAAFLSMCTERRGLLDEIENASSDEEELSEVDEPSCICFQRSSLAWKSYRMMKQYATNERITADAILGLVFRVIWTSTPRGRRAWAWGVVLRVGVERVGDGVGGTMEKEVVLMWRPACVGVTILFSGAGILVG